MLAPAMRCSRPGIPDPGGAPSEDGRLALSFVLIAAGSASRSRVRMLRLRHLALAGAVLALASLAGGGALGFWAATAAAPEAAPPAATPARPSPFTLEQIGALSARLFSLESRASQLSKRIDPPAPAREERKPRASTPGRGGPMQPPSPPPSVQTLGALDAWLLRVDEQINLVADVAALRNIDFMRLPTRLPIPGGDLVSTFGNRVDPFTQQRAFHGGLDFSADQGTPVLSAAGGVVMAAGFQTAYGWMVEIEHGNGLRTRYAHASRLLVKRGAVVAPGERIALVGSTGRSTGPHLHFEVLRGGERIDPRAYLAGL